MCGNIALDFLQVWEEINWPHIQCGVRTICAQFMCAHEPKPLQQLQMLLVLFLFFKKRCLQ